MAGQREHVNKPFREDIVNTNKSVPRGISRVIGNVIHVDKLSRGEKRENIWTSCAACES